MTSRARTPSRITFLVGKPVAIRSIIAGVVERAHHDWPTVSLHRLNQDKPLPDWIFESDLIVQRGLDASELAIAVDLERAGCRCINGIGATSVCADRVDVMLALERARLPVPSTRPARSWADAISIAGGRPIVVKARHGEVGRGMQVTIAPDGVLPDEQPFTGPFVVQEYLPGNPTVKKMYVAGRRVRGLIKTSLLIGDGAGDDAFAFDAAPELSILARDVGDALGLSIFGVDVLNGPSGPMVIDVNPFPGFRGIPDAARLIGGHLLDAFHSASSA